MRQNVLTRKIPNTLSLQSFKTLFSRLSELINTTNGRILYKGGELDRSDLFIPPTFVGKLLFKQGFYCLKDDIYIITVLVGQKILTPNHCLYHNIF
jgi:hypothetical protein